MNRVVIVLLLLVVAFLAYEVGEVRYRLASTAVQSSPNGGGAPPSGVEPSSAPLLPKDDGKISALAHLEPDGRIISLGVPAEMAQERVVRWRVREGDAVHRGQVLVDLEARDRLMRDLEAAESRVAVATARLDQVLAGARRGDLTAQQREMARIAREREGALATQHAVIARARADVRLQQAELRRYEQLFAEGAAPASLLDQKRFAAESSRTALAQALAEHQRLERVLATQESRAAASLEGLAEVRPTDVAAARADVRAAQSEVARARTLAGRAEIRAPQDGVVLKILTREGERISSAGLAQIGRTQTMVGVAEVYDTQISRVRLGQPVRLTGRSLDRAELRGTVTEVGKVVQKQSTFANEPGENFDRRVVEVRVRLDAASSAKVRGLSNLQLEAHFE